MYNILITNDDSVHANGIKALTEVAKQYGRVTVVAPLEGMSGKSHSVTLENLITIERIYSDDNVTIIGCGGTPVDCVKVALDYIMDEKPDLLLSGINHGSNANVSVIYSGTMGAAREGALCGIPSIGFSLLSHNDSADLTLAMKVVKDVIDSVLPTNTNKNLCLNVNVPVIPVDEFKGYRFCRQTMGLWEETFEPRFNPRGKEYVWMKGNFISKDSGSEDSDEWALTNNYASIVPVKIDTTDYDTLSFLNKTIKF